MVGVRPTNLIELLRVEAKYQRDRNGEEDSSGLADLFEMAAEEIDELRERIKHCAVGPCPVLADLALKELV